MVSIFFKTATIAVAVLATTTEAHNKMTLPLPTWPAGFYAQNSPSGTINPSDVLPVPSGMSYSTDPLSNTKAYWTAFNASSYKSLKELAVDSQTLSEGASNECGFSIVDGTPQDLPDMVQWDFFTASHQGPCEVWCDDKLVFENWNCAVDYTETPANLPYDKAACKDSSMLTSYWIALHATPWQMYVNCAPLTGGSASPTNPSTPEATTATATKEPPATTKAPTEAPTVTTATPTATTVTQTEASAVDDEDSNTAGEADLTVAPATTTSAPSIDKCSVRRRH